MDPGAIVSKMSSISNFTNSLNGPLISSSPNYQFPKVNVFTAVKVGDEVGQREAVGEAV